jgi:hypothetical protein
MNRTIELTLKGSWDTYDLYKNKINSFPEETIKRLGTQRKTNIQRWLSEWGSRAPSHCTKAAEGVEQPTLVSERQYQKFLKQCKGEME